MKKILLFLLVACAAIAQPPWFQYGTAVGSGAGGSSCDAPCQDAISDSLDRVASGARVLTSPVATTSYTVGSGTTSIFALRTITFPGDDATGGMKTTASNRQTNVSGGSNMTRGANGMISYFGTNHATKGGYLEYFAGDTGSHVFYVDSTVEMVRISPTGLRVGDGVAFPPMTINSNGNIIGLGGTTETGDTARAQIQGESRQLLIFATQDTSGGTDPDQNLIRLQPVRQQNDTYYGTVEVNAATVNLNAVTEVVITTPEATIDASTFVKLDTPAFQVTYMALGDPAFACVDGGGGFFASLTPCVAP